MLSELYFDLTVSGKVQLYNCNNGEKFTFPNGTKLSSILDKVWGPGFERLDHIKVEVVKRDGKIQCIAKDGKEIVAKIDERWNLSDLVSLVVF